MEDLQGGNLLKGIIPRLGELTKHREARIRGDACHYLALAEDPQAAAFIRPLLEDDDAGVRDIARESLAAFLDPQPHGGQD
jgi:HEAT repeat protein